VIGVAASTILLVAASLTWGIAALRLHEHYATLRAQGQALGAVGGLFADFSTPVTALTGWLATACFGLAAWQVRRGNPEPPAGRDRAATTVAELRAGLRREFRVSRALLLIVLIVAALDCGRLGVALVSLASGNPRAGTALGLLIGECVGLLAATTMLGFWAAGFREQLLRVGAL